MLQHVKFGAFIFNNNCVMTFDSVGYQLLERTETDNDTPVFLTEDFGYDLQGGIVLSPSSDLAVFTQNEKTFAAKKHTNSKEFAQYFEQYKFMVQFNCLGMTDLFFFKHAYNMSVFFAGVPKDVFMNLK